MFRLSNTKCNLICIFYVFLRFLCHLEYINHVFFSNIAFVTCVSLKLLFPYISGMLLLVIIIIIIILLTIKKNKRIFFKVCSNYITYTYNKYKTYNKNCNTNEKNVMNFNIAHFIPSIFSDKLKYI
jgi:hypothetical protein